MGNMFLHEIQLLDNALTLNYQTKILISRIVLALITQKNTQNIL